MKKDPIFFLWVFQWPHFIYCTFVLLCFLILEDEYFFKQINFQQRDQLNHPPNMLLSQFICSFGRIFEYHLYPNHETITSAQSQNCLEITQNPQCAVSENIEICHPQDANDQAQNKDSTQLYPLILETSSKRTNHITDPNISSDQMPTKRSKPSSYNEKLYFWACFPVPTEFESLSPNRLI